MSDRRGSRVDRFRWAFKIVNRLESVQVRYLGMSGLSVLRRTPVLLLQTRGRRTGRARRVVVAYWRQGEVIYVGGGAAGMTRVDWVANLRAHPEGVVWIGRRGASVRVRDLRGAEYDLARAEAGRRWPDTTRYEQMSGRAIPFFAIHAVTTQREGVDG